MTLVELKAALRDKAAQVQAKMTDISQACRADNNRERTPEETTELNELLQEGRALRLQIDRREGDQAMSGEIARLTGDLVPARSSAINGPPATPATRRAHGTLGQQFVESPAFEFFRRGGHRSQSAWRSPSAELFYDHVGGGLYATTLTTDPTSPATGAALVLTDNRPGILPLLFQMPTVADLIAPGTTDSNSIAYMKETTFDNAAAPVAEGGEKPESTLAFEGVTDPVRKIAHWLPTTEEMLEDVAQIRSYIDARMRLGLQLAEDDQLLQGDGTAPNLSGIRDRPGITPAHARGADTNADAILKQMTIIQTTAFVPVDGTVMHPTNWATVQLSKTTTGEYLGAGPWAAPQVPRLWGLPVAVTTAIALNLALTGAFRQAAQIFRKGGIRVEASNSHADFFIKNLVAIRAEERLALAVYREAAFGDITGLN